MEDALHEIESMRRFAGLESIDATFPDETTIRNFRRLLERHDLTDQLANVADIVSGKPTRDKNPLTRSDAGPSFSVSSWFAVPRKRNLLIGSCLTLVAGWALLSPIIFKQSVEAIVNAPISTVRSPIDGLIDIEPIELGSQVVPGQILATASNSRVDNQLLVTIGMEIGLVTSSIEEYRLRISTLETIQKDLSQQWMDFRDQRSRFLSARVNESKSEVAAAEVRKRTAKASLDRAESLFNDEIGPKAKVEEAELSYAQAATALASARARVERLKTEEKATVKGIFAGEDINDSPYSKQRLDEVAIELSQLRPALKAAEKRLETLRTAHIEESDRVTRLGQADLTASITGRMWQRTVHRGDFAEKGQPIATLVDCNSLVVTATVTERTFNRLNFGDSAMFKLTGAGTRYEGSIIQLIGPSTRVNGSGFAIAPSEDSGSEEFRVVVELPELSRQLAETCDIGRTGIVSFGAAPAATKLSSVQSAVAQR
jgi:multidrug resistance efflux pump